MPQDRINPARRRGKWRGVVSVHLSSRQPHWKLLSLLGSLLYKTRCLQRWARGGARGWSLSGGVLLLKLKSPRIPWVHGVGKMQHKNLIEILLPNYYEDITLQLKNFMWSWVGSLTAKYLFPFLVLIILQVILLVSQKCNNFSYKNYHFSF